MHARLQCAAGADRQATPAGLLLLLRRARMVAPRQGGPDRRIQANPRASISLCQRSPADNPGWLRRRCRAGWAAHSRVKRWRRLGGCATQLPPGRPNLRAQISHACHVCLPLPGEAATKALVPRPRLSLCVRCMRAAQLHASHLWRQGARLHGNARPAKKRKPRRQTRQRCDPGMRRRAALTAALAAAHRLPRRQRQGNCHSPPTCACSYGGAGGSPPAVQLHHVEVLQEALQGALGLGAVRAVGLAGGRGGREGEAGGGVGQGGAGWGTR